MKDTLSYLIAYLVDYPDDIIIDELKEENRTVFTIHVNHEDMGKIIGKSGRVIKAIRDVIKILASKQNTYVDVVLAEDKSDQPETNLINTPITE
ncbi:KH domain-containing protein [Candidatus Gottesmanbacteria bacterium]|nr:KH domain-containing protein [Candidatus Gottesmanbacteria bacterium]